MLPDVHCEGFIEQRVANEKGKEAQKGPIALFVEKPTDANQIPNGCTCVGKFEDIFNNATSKPTDPDRPGMAYRGALRWKKTAGDEWTYIRNNGHLGNLDDPSGASKIRGQNIFSRTPIQVDARRV